MDRRVSIDPPNMVTKDMEQKRIVCQVKAFLSEGGKIKKEPIRDSDPRRPAGFNQTGYL